HQRSRPPCGHRRKFPSSSLRYSQIRDDSHRRSPSSVTRAGIRAIGVASTKSGRNGTVSVPHECGHFVVVIATRAWRPSSLMVTVHLRTKCEAGVWKSFIMADRRSFEFQVVLPYDLLDDTDLFAHPGIAVRRRQ